MSAFETVAVVGVLSSLLSTVYKLARENLQRRRRDGVLQALLLQRSRGEAPFIVVHEDDPNWALVQELVKDGALIGPFEGDRYALPDTPLAVLEGKKANPPGAEAESVHP